jgi:hypothetical protein
MEKKMKLVRLSSGEEVICNVEEQENQLVITDGYNMVSTEPGKIGFIPFMAYSKDKQFFVDKSHVLMVCEPVDELVDQVRSMTSGIVIPDKKVIG